MEEYQHPAFQVTPYEPYIELAERLNKIETVRIGDRAGVPSVPNKLAPVKHWRDLEAIMRELGGAVVVQTAFGDSGHTTFLIENEAEYQKHAEAIAKEPEVKVMKRIRCRGSALEACTTKQGTIVGPLMTELVGFKELTPYKGGWRGNEIFAESFTPELREQAVQYTFAFGEQLRKEGCRGYFELDFLIDMDGNQLYLGELNPRITGASSIANHAAFAHADAPLFLFHLLEFADIDFEFDVNDLNARWRERFQALWPEYRRWYLAEGNGARPTYLQSERAMRQHMPELVATWERLVELAGGGGCRSAILELVPPAPLSHRLLAGGLAARRGRTPAGPQLRLQPADVRADNLGDGMERPARDRGFRLPHRRAGWD